MNCSNSFLINKTARTRVRIDLKIKAEPNIGKLTLLKVVTLILFYTIALLRMKYFSSL